MDPVKPKSSIFHPGPTTEEAANGIHETEACQLILSNYQCVGARRSLHIVKAADSKSYAGSMQWLTTKANDTSLVSLLLSPCHDLLGESSLTVHDHCGGGAFAASDDVFCHTRVVARVCHPGLSDDEIMIGRDKEVGVHLWVEDVFIPLPLHLKNTLIH